MITIKQIKQLREETGISIGECKKALEVAKGNIAKAKEILQEWGKKLAEKKQAREAKEGLVEGYIHPTGKIGVLVEVHCETDFVACSADFKNFCHELALQVASMNPENVEDLLSQEYIKDSSRKVNDLMTQVVAKLGENIAVARFVRFEV